LTGKTAFLAALACPGKLPFRSPRPYVGDEGAEIIAEMS